MSRSALEKLRKRMALTAYFRDAFGVDDPNDPSSVRQYYEELDNQEEGYDDEGRSDVYRFVSFKFDGEVLTPEQLLQYDENVRTHTEALNERRSDPITLKPFQVLACLMTEAYLDRVVNNREAFLANLNEFVNEQNEEKGRIKFPEFDDSDLDKLAFWMATGSGKTLLMHINYYQYLDYVEDSEDLPENILLVTPNEGLSEQHIEDLRESSIPCHHFNADTIELQGAGENPVKVIEIQKLVEEKEGEGLSIEVESFGHNNLVLVDEGHKGSGKGQTWRKLRESLAEDGFTFEYSATFGQALSKASVDVEEEYGKSILFDYSYPRFYDDGYGKDYHIVNLESEVDTDLRDRYLLANLLTYYEQIHVFNQDPDTVRNTYNIKFPLLVFIGHTVNAATQSEVSKNEDRTLTDVEKSLNFMAKVLRNEDNWVPEAIDRVLQKDAGLVDDDEIDPFGDALEALRDTDLDGEDIYDRLLEEMFHVRASSGLDLVNIENADGEIGLRASGTDDYFGVINIGGDRVFLDRVEGEYEHITVESDQFKKSLFRSINKRDSPINVLMGSRKFIEGWDSWRVSTMGLMNFGRGEGSQVIQLFGRGVRLLGKDRTLKRSSELEVDPPSNLPLLETLNVFGVRADYMAQFRDYLSDEGIDTDPREVVEIETQTQDHFQNQGLLVVRPEVDSEYVDEVNLELEATGDITPEIDIMPQVGVLSSRDESANEVDEKEPRTIPEEYLDLLDWHEIYRKVWQFRKEKGYRNLVCEKRILQKILSNEYYTLYCPESMLEVEHVDDLEQIQQIAVMILRKYIKEFYSGRQSNWEQSQLSYVPMDDELTRDQGNFFDRYTLSVKTSAEDFLSELQEAVEDDSLYTNADGKPNRVHFDRHLYLPLIAEETGIDEEDVDYSPPPLNKGEKRFVTNLKSYFQSPNGQKILDSWEVYLLRNQSRGKGVGLLSDGNRFFPDFIMWLQNGDTQHIVFLEPHGMVREGEPVEDHRVKFYDGIDSYESELAERTGKDHVSLHSYVISQTNLNDLRDLSRVDTREEFHEAGLYFPNEVSQIVEDVLESASAESQETTAE
ncbi:DEAD/DEAH box helicase family protein [Haloprofundus halobius]|uniref:DEAD/DEAH box helicase family protein n=1 Tax=Haloprofundus halobius TaxID=2876194 RepID=UPI001CCBC6A0|nr:DEAD/DEAH box helicase family protein [Haloprofundus halobius]